MQEKRFLLPFTHGVDTQALRHVLQLTKAHNATLVALALIPLIEQQSIEDARLERVQQAKDFLAFLHTQADIHHVVVEEHERYTYNVLESISNNAQKMHCQNILLSYEGEKVNFLHANEAEQLRVNKPLSLYILCRQPKPRDERGILRKLTTRLAKVASL